MDDAVQQIKLLTIGDSGVGKSWLLIRWAGDGSVLTRTSSAMPTIGIDFKMKTLVIDGDRVKVQTWDTAGQERFKTITTSYYRNAQGILLVYDITDRSSFFNIRSWMEQIQANADVEVNVVLVGNKLDLESKRAVLTTEGMELAREYGIPFWETSAYMNINVDDAFSVLTTNVYRRVRIGGPSTVGGTTNITAGNGAGSARSPSCC